MAACKRPRGNSTCTLEAPPAATDSTTLPSDLLLEIVARSDISTVVAFTAACKLLRGDILSPSFIGHITQRGGTVPPCILAYLNVQDPVYTHDDMDDPPPPPFSLVHPATPAASALLDDHISPFVSRLANDLLNTEYHALTSRGGLVLFRRQNVINKIPDLCVYDPLSGHRTFFPDPLYVAPKRRRCLPSYVLLTAEDGIDCSFLLFALDHVCTVPGNIYATTIEVHTATSTSSTCAHAIASHDRSGLFSQLSQAMDQNIAVLKGGVIHWLVHEPGESVSYIVSYNVCTKEQGRVQLPGPVIDFTRFLHLGSYYSPDGKKLLRVLTYNEFKISV
jgi:hypothetical protein